MIRRLVCFFFLKTKLSETKKIELYIVIIINLIIIISIIIIIIIIIIYV